MLWLIAWLEYITKYLLDYSLKPLNALLGLGFLESIKCILSFAYTKILPPKDLLTFESWVTNRFGKRLFNIFFKSYSEKLWGIKCNELDSDFASQRIKKLSLIEALKSAVLKIREINIKP